MNSRYLHVTWLPRDYDVTWLPGSCGYSIERNEHEIKEALENFAVALNNTKVENVEKQVLHLNIKAVIDSTCLLNGMNLAFANVQYEP